MFTKSLTLAVLALAPAVAAEAGPRKAPAIDVNALPIGAAPRIDYATKGLIHTADGQTITPPAGTGLVTTAGGRYVVASYDLSGTRFDLVDGSGAVTRGATTYPIGASKFGGGYALLSHMVAKTQPTPLTLVDLSTGQQHEIELKKGRPLLLHVGADGATFSPKAPHSAYRYSQVRLLRPDGTVKTLFTLRKDRRPLYASPANNVVISTSKGRVGISTVRKPNTIRWSAKWLHPTALSPDSSLLVLSSYPDKNRYSFEVRRVSTGKVVGRYTFTTEVLSAPVFEDADTFIASVRDRPGTRESTYLPVWVRCTVGGGCERLPPLPALDYYAFAPTDDLRLTS